MKRFAAIMCALVMALMFNCSKSSKPAISISGKWTVNSWTVTGCKDPTNNFSQAFECPGSLAKWCYIYTFNSNGTCAIERTATSTETDTGTYTIIGNFVSIAFTGSNEGWNFVLANNTLTFTITNPVDGCLNTFVLTK